MTTTSTVGANNTANTANSSSGNAAAAKASVDYNSFLKLLVTQMQNQDPTQPMDATQYVSQLATFSNVEQAVQMNSKLETLIANSSLSQAEGWIGRTLTSADGTVSGVVKSVTIQSSGMLAELEDGKTMLIGQGVKIS
ncbi:MULTISPECIES: flagellar hook assembly protein FlgD [Ochrobactrum]|uniref:Basal-body rod modification protein FlgD n=1 Tax=Ochrobactrum quorumnocens TaxID=271865 RepID=A0A248UDR1_9HYPH|nr:MULTISPECIES: flagellar hook assembly protein FlgD [Brucella/Ochrobactrum group]MBD7989870.1 flagellar hook assembly protein FlgD [Ochrobactrum gallinarum]ASV84806.1 flagellar hook capping - N-terminal region family protein [[Ochrobactrum] quorumnocens]KAA9368514.1 flagellar hook assembly protein FlgD [[Ochrobactrum] quorumnocens]MCV9908635.1 flagellar hook assembly protein FlgD [Brucella sp. HL-2]MDH7791006.1 flagellar basal-body rod modification protein FlgD [Ochrobactrum sp. AN78]